MICFNIISECDMKELCPLDKFIEILKPLVIDGTVDDWFRMCNAVDAKKSSYSGKYHRFFPLCSI